MSFLFVGALAPSCAAASPESPFDPRSLALPEPGQRQLRLLSPTVLEIAWISSGGPEPKPPGDEDDGLALFRLIESGQQKPHVLVDEKPAEVKATGFKRRAVYAPLRQRDLRIGNYLYLQLAEPAKPDERLSVTLAGFPFASKPLETSSTPLRFSPAIHVNQTGYHPDWPKVAHVGFYLGSLGELEVPPDSPFELVDAVSGEVVHRGQLSARPDVGFPYGWYQKVFAASFGSFKTPGRYRVVVPGLGASLPFRIHEGVPAAFARTYALGLYHQRCGTDNALPFTRFTHAACHTAHVEVPTLNNTETKELIATASKGIDNPRQTARPLKDLTSSLYPFVRKGKIDVGGGHHDAGDYSRYTTNSAGLVHHLVFAADAFPGVGELDNLGLPESGDGKSDLLQTAKWEADFLAKMQDDDGGFYFLVYPRDRRYEGDVLPEHGDPQVVWPKTTAVTAAAVAALAQTASSPRFQREFPEDAKRYLASARRGWDFLEKAFKQYGVAGSYQKLTHYGDEFGHDDELAWAAAELFAATGERAYAQRVKDWLAPADPETRRWGWWRMCESHGRAIRAYAFAARTGRLKADQLDPALLAACETEIDACARDWADASRQSAYGLSVPVDTKRVLGAGWFFPLDKAFDLATACQLDYPSRNDPRAGYFSALLANMNYEAGANPVNVSYLTGLGMVRPREIVHQYALNDRRRLPPTGVPIGAIQAGFGWLDHYKQELGELCFPPDGDPREPYALYDRWGDSFNLATEFVVVNQARALGVTAWLMAQTHLRQQPWRSAPARIDGLHAKVALGRPLTVRLVSPELDLAEADIVWEAQDQEPARGPEFTFTPRSAEQNWIEAEALLPDGRRVFASGEFSVFLP